MIDLGRNCHTGRIQPPGLPKSIILRYFPRRWLQSSHGNPNHPNKRNLSTASERNKSNLRRKSPRLRLKQKLQPIQHHKSILLRHNLLPTPPVRIKDVPSRHIPLVSLGPPIHAHGRSRKYPSPLRPLPIPLHQNRQSRTLLHRQTQFSKNV